MRNSKQVNEQFSLSASSPSVHPRPQTPLAHSAASSPARIPRLRAIHVVSGDRWAGAEVQLFTLLRQLQNNIDLHVILMNDGELRERCQALEIPFTVLDESRYSSLELLKAMLRCLRSLQPDIIHTHRQKENVLGSLANLLGPRAPCVRTVHGAPEFSPNLRQNIQIAVDRFCGRYLQDSVIAVSAELHDKLHKQFPARQLQLIQNGIDPDEVQWDSQPPLCFSPGKQVCHVGLVGRLEAVKRADIFLNMAALLIGRSKSSEWCFHVFGDGSQTAAMKQLARHLGIWDQLRFHGHCRHIRRAIAGLDAVVMPSDHEGMPMTALETVALGVRLVAHDTGGLSDLLSEHQHFLVSDHSAEGYANALEAAFDFAPPTTLKADYLASTNASLVVELYQNLSPRLETE